MKETGWNRRDFLKAGAAGVAAVGSSAKFLAAAEPGGSASTPAPGSPTKFENETMSRIAYLLGGIGAGKAGKPFLEVRSGTISYQKIEYVAS
jgi:TAT (twin-arginine translocation) pathway signal sequence